MIKKVMLLLSAVMTLAGCVKKGEEDPLISIRSRKARLTGNWEVQNITIAGGIDLTDYRVAGQEVLCANFNFEDHYQLNHYTVDFEKNENARFAWDFNHLVYSPAGCDYEHLAGSVDRHGTWSFTNQKEGLDFVYEEDGKSRTQHFEIIGLSNRSLLLTYEQLLPVRIENGEARVSAPTLYTATLSLKRID